MSKIIKIKKGLDIPLAGEAEKILNSAPRSKEYAVCPPDFHGLTPKMLVKEGDKVKAGTPLFFDKYNERVLFTSPVSGTYSELVRGEKRRILEVRITADENDEYLDLGAASPETLSREEIIEKLLKSGMWPSIRQRPYDVIANPEVKPKAIFISAFDSAPLAADLDFILNGQEKEFAKGIDVAKKLTNGKVHLGISPDTSLNKIFNELKDVEVHRFKGPHPAGNVGVQIHHIDPINKGEAVWYIGVQELIIIGRLFEKGVYDASKIVALVGSEVLNPRYYRVKTGAIINSIVDKNVKLDENVTLRYINGNPLTGHKVKPSGFLGWYDNQITILPEGDKPELFGWIAPNFDKFSLSRTFPAFLTPWRKFRHTTNIRSGERAFVITGLYEKVLPMDIYPMQLLKSVMINDIDMMEKLGMYEISPEDMALCEYVCPSKIEFQTIIREGLDELRKEFA